MEHRQLVHRLHNKMKSKTALCIVACLLIIAIGIAWLIFSTRDRVPAQFFPAEVNRDCAPWDGSAFTVSIPVNDGTVIDVSIWRSPDIKIPVTFSFPDKSMSSGDSLLLLQGGSSEQLKGTVFFKRVESGEPIEGEFDLFTQSGRRLKGKFKAEWGDLSAMCG